MNFQEEGPTNPIFERIKKIEKNDQIFLKCDQTFDKLDQILENLDCISQSVQCVHQYAQILFHEKLKRIGREGLNLLTCKILLS